jgi:hypothetical protein
MQRLAQRVASGGVVASGLMERADGAFLSAAMARGPGRHER